MYRDLSDDSLQFHLVERTIRRKVRGEASDVLNAKNVTCAWHQIKSTLMLYHKDKRDVKTLDYELTCIKKGYSESLAGYYSRVNELLTAMIAQVQTDSKYSLHANVHINYFREKALNSIRGLEKPLSTLLKTADPKTFSKAYQFCLDYFNMDIRSAPYKNQYGNQNSSNTPKPKGMI